MTLQPQNQNSKIALTLVVTFLGACIPIAVSYDSWGTFFSAYKANLACLGVALGVIGGWLSKSPDNFVKTWQVKPDEQPKG